MSISGNQMLGLYNLFSRPCWGIHHPDEHVRRRCFYLFWKFVKECRTEMDPELVPPILKAMMVSSYVIHKDLSLTNRI
jgi:hypothetical protein